MESCGMSLIKYILFFFNLIFAISGIGIIAAGGLVLTEVGEFNHFLEGRILAPPVVLIVAGAIVFFIAFLGCYGAIKENYNMLMAFAVALALIFIIELAVGIAASVFKNDFAMVMKGTMKDSLTNYTDADSIAWQNVQKKLDCCGVESSNDWTMLATSSNYTKLGLLPPSCCKDLPAENQCRPYDTTIHKMGCYEALEMRVQKSASVLIGVGIGIAFVEVAGIVLACCLAMSIKKEGGEK